MASEAVFIDAMLLAPQFKVVIAVVVGVTSNSSAPVFRWPRKHP
jgi:hypothetical protein